MIHDVKMYGDFFSKKPIEEPEKVLFGTLYEAVAIEEYLPMFGVSDYIQGMSQA